MKSEREARDDAEIAAAAAHRPEEILVLGATGSADLAVRGDDLDGFEIVDRPAESAREIAEAAAERESRNADLGDEAEHRRQAMRLSCRINVSQAASSADCCDPCIRIDRDVAQLCHVEHDSVLGDRRAGDVVATALDAEQ